MARKKDVKKIVSFYLLLCLFCWGCSGNDSNSSTTSADNTAASSVPEAKSLADLKLNRYEAEILEFERENQYRGVQQGSVLFLGGAPIRKWTTLAKDFQGMPVKNRGFGNATLLEINYYYGRLTDPFQAELMVVYAGESDIVLGATPEEALAAFENFQKQIALSHRTTRIVYIGIMPSPSLWKYWPNFQKANELIKKRAAEFPSIDYVDISQEMLGADGKPIPQLFEADGYSLSPAGYARLANVVSPVLEKMF